MNPTSQHLEPQRATPVARAPLAYSVREACAATSLGRSFIYEEIKRGAIRARKVGARTLILESDLREYLQRA